MDSSPTTSEDNKSNDKTVTPGEQNPNAPSSSGATGSRTVAETNGDAKTRFTELFNEYVKGGMEPNVAAATALKAISSHMANQDNSTSSGNSNDAIDTNTNASSVSSSSAKRPSPSISSPGRGKKMKDSKDACVKVSEGESQEVLVKTAAKMTLEEQISKSKNANGVIDYDAFLAILNGTSCVKDLNDLFGRQASLNTSFIDVSMLCSKENHAIELKTVQKVYDLLLNNKTYDSAKNAMMNASYLLASQLQMWCKRLSKTMTQWDDPYELRGFFILMLNPVIRDPEYFHFTQHLFLAASLLPECAKTILQNWLHLLPSDVFDSMVHSVQQYITCAVYKGSNIDPYISSATIILKLFFSVFERRYAANDNDSKGDKALSTTLTYRDFENDAINDEVDLEEDFKTWYLSRSDDMRRNRSHSNFDDSDFSFCRFPFVLDAASKANILRYEASVEQRRNQRQSLIEQVQHMIPNALGQYTVRTDVMYLVLKVRRDHIVEDTLTKVDAKPNSDLKKPLKIIFDGEEGVDEGGVKKEFFQVMLRELLDPNYGMFVYNDKSRQLWFNCDTFENPVKFHLFGTLLGLAIYNQVILDIYFPNVVFKLLVQGKSFVPKLEDLKDIDVDLHQSLQMILTCQDASAVGSTFEISRKSMFGEVINTELKPGGASIEVTNENREEFVNLYVKHLIVDSVLKQYDAFRRGFQRVCDSKPFTFFRADELELLICGSPKLDFHELEDSTRYEGFESTSQVVIDFWDIVHNEMTEKERRLLLSFATGSDRAPIKGLGEIKFVIARAGPNSDQLPTSHTCFNHLLIPEYDTRNKLKKNLMLAITQSEGFGLL
eukprot:g2784.t1